MKKRFLLGLCIFVGLCGCARANRNTESPDCNISEESNHIEGGIESDDAGGDWSQIDHHSEGKLCENVNVDADIVFPDELSGEVKKYNVYVQDPDSKKIFEMLGLSSDDKEQIMDGVYRFQDKTVQILDGENGFVGFYPGEAYGYNYYDSGYENKCSNIENFGENKNLDFATVDSVKSVVLEKLKQAGVENVVVQHVYALPKEYHNYIYDEAIAEGLMESEDKPKKILDCYEVDLTTEYEGIPVFEDVFVTGDDKSWNGAGIRMLYCKDGILDMYIPNQYKIKDEDGTVNVLGLDEIMDKLKTKMENIILTDLYNVRNIRICYLPQVVNIESGEFQLIPVWEIEIETNVVVDSGEQNMNTVQYIFRADTGEEIPW